MERTDLTSLLVSADIDMDISIDISPGCEKVVKQNGDADLEAYPDLVCVRIKCVCVKCVSVCVCARARARARMCARGVCF